MEIPKEHIPFLSGWVNEFQNQDKEHYQSAIRLERDILQKMWDNNLELKEYKKESLLRVINKRWRWATATWSYGSELGEILPVEQLFKQYNPFSDMGIKNDEGGGEQREKEHLGFKERIKKY